MNAVIFFIVGIPLIAGLLALAYGAVSKGKSLATAEEGGVVTGTGMAEIHEGEVFSGTKNEMGFGDNRALADAIDRNTRALGNMELTAGRGEIRVMMEPELGGALA